MILSTVVLLILLVRASLAAVLVAAGVAKLADTTSFVTTLTGLGMPASSRRGIHVLALAVPIAELVLGLAVVSGLASNLVDSVVLLLMCSFSGVVLVALRKAPNVTCRCFGALSDSQFDRRSLARSLLLSGLAAVVVWSDTAGYVQVASSPATITLLLAIYIVFAIAAAQAARTLATLKAEALS